MREPLKDRQFLARQKGWIEAQKQLARFSDQGKQVAVGNSRHCIQCDAPESIVKATREVVAGARLR